MNEDIIFCNLCKRFLKNTQWLLMERESPELLSLCLKKLKNLNSIKLIDSKFIYTEPHSRRIKVQITIQKEIQEGVTVQDQMTLEFEEVN